MLDPVPPASCCSRTTPQKVTVKPPSVPGADGRVFVKISAVNIGSFHIAPTQLIAVIARKIKHKHIQKERTFPLPPITSLRPLLGGLLLETIQPLVTWAEDWQAIPRVSNWVLGIIKWDYTLQFAQRPPRFGDMVCTSVQHSNFHVLHAKVMSLLAKGAMEMVSPAKSESGFYSRYFLVPKKDGGLRPILDLRHLNRALMKRPFRIITSKQILTGSSWDSPLREWLRYVRRSAGPRRAHLPGFIIWKFRPYRTGSFLHNRLTLVIWKTIMGVCLLLVCSWPSIELWGCTDLFGTITQGRVDLDEFDPITYCRASLYNTWSFWATLGALDKFKCLSFP